MRGSPQRFLNTPAPLPPNLSFVLNLSPSAMTLGLGNVRALLEGLDHPENNFRCVIVAGTNGKGSVTAFLSSILSSNGIRTGWYSSPHVYSVNERICVDNVPVDIDRMEEAASRIVPLHEEIGYSYFEALTAIAFLVFEKSEVEVAVLETGLGGRFDATNVVEPKLTVLTSVSVDHRRMAPARCTSSLSPLRIRTQLDLWAGVLETLESQNLNKHVVETNDSVDLRTAQIRVDIRH